MNGLPPELQERMVRFFRWATDPKRLPAHQAFETQEFSGWADEIKAIAAMLPPPVDPDIEEARKLLRRQDAGWFAPSMDSNPAWQQTCTGPGLALAAIKRGRELERSGK